MPEFAPLFRAVVPGRIGFEDFRRNGLLLPSEEAVALRTGLPLHRGPHRSYDEMVAQRVGDIESEWAARRRQRPKISAIDARLKLILLQRALRTELLSRNPPVLALSRSDVLGQGRDFTALDAMAERLWAATDCEAEPLLL